MSLFVEREDGMRYRSKKGTVINIPDGLTSAQIKQIKERADMGYGTDAQNMADKLGKKATPSAPAVPAVPAVPAAKSLDDQIQRTQEEIAKRNEAGQKETPNLTARLNDLNAKKAGIGADTGTGTGTNPATGTTTPNESRSVSEKTLEEFLGGIYDKFEPINLEGAPKILSAEGYEADRAKDQEALYAESTKYLDRNRARSLEEAKQELANRGIPYDPAAAQDPNSKNLYGRIVGAIEENYRAEQDSALNNARTGSYASMNARVGVNKTAYDAFLESAKTKFGSQLQSSEVANNVLKTLIDKYGYTRQEAIAEMDRHSKEKIARWQVDAENRRTAKIGSGGGSRGGSGDSGGGGFQLPG